VVKISWVTLDRICEQERRCGRGVAGLGAASGRPLRSDAAGLSDEQLLATLRSFGLELDRDGVEQLCAGALSVEEVAAPLIAGCHFRTDAERMGGDWIWICLLALWQRWWPERVGLELLDDQVQSGYGALERSDAAAASIWVEAWSGVLGLSDAAGIVSIDGFDERFPMTQSLYNWSQDLEDALGNAGLADPAMLQARISVCEQALSRFPHEERLMTENRRRALAESYFELGHTGTAEELFDAWLGADPGWGFGWIGWACCYRPRPGRPGDPVRSEELLRRGDAAPGVRDRDAIADWLGLVCEETGRPEQARCFQQQAQRLRRPAAVTAPGRPAPTGPGQHPVPGDASTVGMRGDGAPSAGALAAPRTVGTAPATPRRGGKVGRNAPCPCGSGRKYKKCCGRPGQPTGPISDAPAGTGHG
jgi:hypothetical protein